MKIWIVYFYLNQPGGVNTWIENAIEGFRAAGHVCDLSYATLSGGMKVDISKHTRMGVTRRTEDRLPADCIPYAAASNIKDFRIRSAKYDIVVFAHPAPHDTKAYDDPDMMWLKLYEESSVPCVAIFHDDSWKKTNPWVVKFAPYVEGIVCAQHRFYEYLLSDDGFPAGDSLVCWENFPIAWNDELGLYDDMKDVDPRVTISVAQWQGWKNHKYLIPQLVGVESFAMDLYGVGIQYYYIRKTEEWRQAIGHDYQINELVNENSWHNYMGYVSYSKMPAIMMGASAAIDMSTRGRENMGMIEPMAYGCVSIITEEAMNSSPWQKLEDVTVVAPLDDIVLATGEVCQDYIGYKPVREAALQYVRDNHTIESVAGRLVQYFQSILDGDVGNVGELKGYVT